MTQSLRDGPRRLFHFTPLRYPGGKAKLAAYVKEIICTNKLCDGEYVEPYAGGAAIALELLFQEYVSQIRINDVSRHVYAFWKSVLDDTEELCRLVKNTRLSVPSWDRQKRIFANPADHDDTQLGFATFFLNRTNRSGILNGGIIGGRDQAGEWKIDARYNVPELIFRIESIAKMKSRIRLTRCDAISFLRRGLPQWPKKTLLYLDPPYYNQGTTTTGLRIMRRLPRLWPPRWMVIPGLCLTTTFAKFGNCIPGIAASSTTSAIQRVNNGPGER